MQQLRHTAWQRSLPEVRNCSMFKDRKVIKEVLLETFFENFKNKGEIIPAVKSIRQKQ